ncbi:MAG: flavodoxin-dependent (E)-4-hydroxy-3-methylbut-2-enyl-diphosphate synthase, partial [Adlercreutzia sp.]|nr:flavodoxin-dependent (E)-4-hydroxy-3-methylbut-2-enyl-diphosphate synthase [Adlercreutzia sp.]
MDENMKPHQRTRRIMVGAVPVGGGAPVAVQSMLNAPADDVAANLAQIEALTEAGCE